MCKAAGYSLCALTFYVKQIDQINVLFGIYKCGLRRMYECTPSIGVEIYPYGQGIEF